MSTTTQAAEKRTAVEHLEFTTRTSKRVSWESWEFTIVAPCTIRVTNASYGYLKEDHAYTVDVEERDGVVVPVECECPADQHSDRDCKHKLALAAVGGRTVLNAAADFENPAPVDDDTTESGTDELGGGAVLADAKLGTEESCPECDALSGLPCWPCYRDGKRA